MITAKQAMENPGLMIRYKEYLKNVEIFRYSWYDVFQKYPYLYREFSYRFDEMDEIDVAFALINDPTLVSDLKNHLHNLSGWGVSHAVKAVPALVLDLKNHLHKIRGSDINWLGGHRPELSLCMKYREYPDKAEAAYYIGYPHKLDGLGKEEKREMSERILELLKEEKT